jgi:uncharacterized membrane protein
MDFLPQNPLYLRNYTSQIARFTGFENFTTTRIQIVVFWIVIL